LNHVNVAKSISSYINPGTGFIIGLLFLATYLIVTLSKKNKVINPFFVLYIYFIGASSIFGVKIMCMALINKCELSDNEATALIFGGFTIIVFAFFSLSTAIKYSEKPIEKSE